MLEQINLKKITKNNSLSIKSTIYNRMKNSTYILIALFLIISLASCAREEKIIDNGIFSYSLLVSYKGSTGLNQVSLPDGNLLNADIIKANNADYNSGNISKIVEYRNQLFVFIPDLNKVGVFDSKTFKNIYDIDFSSLKGIPTDICFPNSTDAYITLPNLNQVALVDIYTQQISRYLDIAGYPSSIANVGNQIAVTCKNTNQIAIIDSREYKETQRFDIYSNPLFIEVSKTNEFVIVCEGTGLDSVKKEAKVIFMDPNSKALTATLDLTYTTEKAINQIPNSLAITMKDYAFVCTNRAIFRIDTKNRRVNKQIPGTYDKVTFSSKLTQLIYYKSNDANVTELSFADQTSAEVQVLVKLNQLVSSMFIY